MTKTAWLRGLPASQPSLPAKGSCVAPCLQSRLPFRLQSTPPPPSSPSPFRRPDLPAPTSWPSGSIRGAVQARERPDYHASTFPRPAPAAAIALPPMPFVSVRLRVLRDAPDTQPASHKRHRPTKNPRPNFGANSDRHHPLGGKFWVYTHSRKQGCRPAFHR